MDPVPIGEAASLFAPDGHRPEFEPYMTRPQILMARLFQSPHTIAALIVAIAILYYTGLSSMEDDLVATTTRGLAAVSAIVMLFALLHFRDGPFTRPHPALWRVVLGAGLLYQMFLVFLLFQPPAQARKLFSYWYPEVGVPLEPVMFAEHCELTWANIAPLLDRFFICHFIGWMTKALMMRDFYLCWIQAVQWEFLEIFFSFALPNFRECWWDQWIMDVILCNAAGIWFGMKLVKWLQVGEMNWLNRQASTRREKLKNVATKTFLGVVPKGAYSQFNWDWLTTPKKFLLTMFILVILNVVDLNSFILKQVLWIPHDNPLNLYRLVLMWLIGLPAAQQYYDYVTNERCARLGAAGWVLISLATTEIMVWAKCAPSAGVYEGIEQDPRLALIAKVLSGAAVMWFVLWFRKELWPFKEKKC